MKGIVNMKIIEHDIKCRICGRTTDFVIRDEAVLLRDARCKHCGAALRNSDLTEELLNELCTCDAESSISDRLQMLEKFRILNTCSSGYIHKALSGLPNYIVSEYFDDVPNGNFKGDVLCVDLMNIPFDDNALDVIISEDVFEHISDYKKAFSEILRVLKPGGIHVFTIPLHEGRKTVSRIGNPKKIYHGDPLRDSGALVMTDFGDDIVDYLNDIGYETSVAMKHKFFSEDEITDCDNTYEEYLEKITRMDEYFKYNSVVFVSKKKR